MFLIVFVAGCSFSTSTGQVNPETDGAPMKDASNGSELPPADARLCFGAGFGMDAFLVAFKIPNFGRRLFAEGAFSQAFVPVLAEYRATRSEAEVRDLVGRGVVFEDYDFPALKTVNHVARTPGIGKSAWFKDPDGNTLALFQAE